MMSNYIETEFFDDDDIPAVFEEEIIADDIFENDASSKDPTVATMSSSSTFHPRSILIPKSEVKFKQTLTVNRSLLRPLNKPNQSLNLQVSSKFRHTTTLTKTPNFVLNEHTMSIFRSKIKAIQKRKAQAIAKERKKKPKKMDTTKLKVQNLSSARKYQPTKKAQPKNFIYIGPKKPKIVNPQNSGEIIRVEKAESDIEVDILSNSEDEIHEIPLENNKVEDVSADDTVAFEKLKDSKLDDGLEKRLNELKKTDYSTYEHLVSEDFPKIELMLENSNITNLERFFHFEFFQNLSQTKTPER